MSWRYRILWTLVFLAALLAAANALLLMTLDAEGRGPFAQRFQDALWMGWAHAGGGALAILLGPLQWLGGIRHRYPWLHRWTGRCYLLAVFIAAISGLYFAASSIAGWISGSGFALASVVWIATGAVAWRKILAGDIAAHRRWMLRNYAVTFAAVTLRFLLPILFGLGLDVETVFRIVAWLSWTLNLLVVEAWLRWQALTLYSKTSTAKDRHCSTPI